METWICPFAGEFYFRGFSARYEVEALTSFQVELHVHGRLKFFFFLPIEIRQNPLCGDLVTFDLGVVHSSAIFRVCSSGCRCVLPYRDTDVVGGLGGECVAAERDRRVLTDTTEVSYSKYEV